MTIDKLCVVQFAVHWSGNCCYDSHEMLNNISNEMWHWARFSRSGTLFHIQVAIVAATVKMPTPKMPFEHPFLATKHLDLLSDKRPPQNMPTFKFKINASTQYALSLILFMFISPYALYGNMAKNAQNHFYPPHIRSLQMPNDATEKLHWATETWNSHF